MLFKFPWNFFSYVGVIDMLIVYIFFDISFISIIFIFGFYLITFSTMHYCIQSFNFSIIIYSQKPKLFKRLKYD